MVEKLSCDSFLIRVPLAAPGSVIQNLWGYLGLRVNSQGTSWDNEVEDYSSRKRSLGTPRVKTRSPKLGQKVARAFHPFWCGCRVVRAQELPAEKTSMVRGWPIEPTTNAVSHLGSCTARNGVSHLPVWLSCRITC